MTTKTEHTEATLHDLDCIRGAARQFVEAVEQHLEAIELIAESKAALLAALKTNKDSRIEELAKRIIVSSAMNEEVSDDAISINEYVTTLINFLSPVEDGDEVTA